MSYFCQQCSIERFGEDHRDLANLTVSGAAVLWCEGCGMVMIDQDGKCVDDGCPVHSKQLRTVK